MDSLHRYLFFYLFTLDLLGRLRSNCPNQYAEIKDPALIVVFRPKS